MKKFDKSFSLASGLCFSRQPRDYGAASRGLLTMRAQVFLWLVLFISTFGMPELVQARSPGASNMDARLKDFWTAVGTVKKGGDFFVVVPHSDVFTFEEAKKECAGFKADGRTWRVPTRGEADLRTYFLGTWVQIWHADGLCYSERYGPYKSDECTLMCVADSGAPPPSKVDAPPKSSVENRTITLTRTPDDSELLKARDAQVKEINRENAKVQKEQDMKVAAENSAREIKSMEYELDQRRICKKPGMQGMCSCIRFEPVPPGGRRTCGK